MDQNHDSPPLFSLATANLNSASAYPMGRTQHKRARIIRARIEHLCARFDLVCVQETHFAREESSYFRAFTHSAYYNNGDRGRAGTAILVGKKVLADYTAHEVDLGVSSKGRVQVLSFKPKPRERGSAPLRPFYLANLYLSSGESNQEKAAQLKCLQSLEPAHILMAGDFNFTEHEQDGGAQLGGEAIKVWDSLKARWRLREAYQEAHTFHRGGYSSRLDRIYINDTDTDRLLARPVAFIPRMKYSTAGAFADHAGLEQRRRRHIPDHLPLALRFVPTQGEGGKRDFNCPKWLASDVDFLRMLDRCWEESEEKVLEDTGPYWRLLRWKEAVKCATKKCFKMKTFRQKNFQDYAAELGRAKQLLRLIRAKRQTGSKIKKAISAAPQLLDFISRRNGAWTDVSLTNRIEELLLLVGLKEPVEAGAVDCFQVNERREINVLQELARSLPSDRERLVGIRPEEGEDPVFDPESIGKVIKKHWTPVWAKKGVRRVSASDYLRSIGYNKRIDPALAPKRSSLDDYLELIRSSNDSCAGPDGIPFAIYRAKIDVVAPLLLAVEDALAEGIPPPDEAEFNFARLFLIPKGGTMDPLDHRPISVTNADNRLVAQALTRSTTPVLQAFLEATQKGFVPGRLGDDHILAINELFYSKAAIGEKAYLLFIDVKKAFDSLDHDYILGVLEQVGYPAWFRRVIGLLLTNVAVRPVLGAKVDTSIDIFSGVKQGCPLSPLLFVLCYDPLLFALKSKGITAFGYADDLAAAPSDIGAVVTTLEIFKAFTGVSGLGINVSKTKLVRTVDDYSDKEYLDIFGYKKVELAPRATHLGVLIGKDVDSKDIFAKAFAKFERRAAQYAPTVKRLSLAKRVLVCNCFLTPLFLYLARYFIMPYNMVLEAKSTIRKLVIPFNGGAFAYPHLLRLKRAEFGFSTPLRDLWATNYALLASALDGAPLEGHPFAYCPDMEYVSREDWGEDAGAGRILEHRFHALFQYLDSYAPRDRATGLIVTHINWADKPGARRAIYGALVNEGYAYCLSDSSDEVTSLQRKITRIGLPPPAAKEAVRRMREHAKLVKKVTPTVWDCWLRLAFNALPFMGKLVSTHAVEWQGAEKPACGYCGEGEDSTAHVFGGCPVVLEARASFCREHSWALHAGIEGALLAFAPLSADHTLGCLEFNYAVWRVYQDFIRPNRSAGTIGTRIHLVRRLVDRAKLGLSRAMARARKKRPRPHAPDPDALTFYTDGSSDPNPGPTGAGVFSPQGCSIAVALGVGTNNVGELFAIGLACEAALSQAFRLSNYTKVIVYTDSTYAIGCIQDNWASAPNLALIRAARERYRRLCTLITVEMVWVKGHSGLEGNEEADRLAGVGSKAAKAGGGWRVKRAEARHGFGAVDWLKGALELLPI